MAVAIPLPQSLCFSSSNFVKLCNNSSSNNSSTCLGFKDLKSRNQKLRVFVCRAESSSSSSVVFQNLDADDFRHPLDKQNTLIFRAIPRLTDIGKALLGFLQVNQLLTLNLIPGTVADQVMLLENIGTSVLVSKNQVRDIYP